MDYRSERLDVIPLSPLLLGNPFRPFVVPATRLVFDLLYVTGTRGMCTESYKSTCTLYDARRMQLSPRGEAGS